MRSSRARLQDDLRGLLSGEVHCDDVTRSVYASDAGGFCIPPEGVVFPRNVSDVVACVRYAAEHGLTLHPRGAGTSRSGGGVGRGIILDMSRLMRRLVRVDETTIHVQAGATRHRVNEMLMRHQQRLFGPDPGCAITTTFGSIVASDTAGPRWLRYGSPRDQIVALEAVLATGEVISLQRSTLPTRSITESNAALAHGVALARSIVHRGHAQIVDALYQHLSLASLPPSDNSIPRHDGYNIDHVLTGIRGDAVDLMMMLAGSEGSLAILTEMTLSTTPMSRVRVGAVLTCSSLERAARAIPLIRTANPSRCEMIDRRQLTLLAEREPIAIALVPNDAMLEAALLVELDGDDRDNLTERLTTLANELANEGFAISMRLTHTAADEAMFHRLCGAIPHLFLMIEPSVVPVPLFDDMVVPIDELPAMILFAQQLFQQRGITLAVGGHWGQGQLRLQPLLSSLDVTNGMMDEVITERFYDELLARGGSIASTAPLGRARTPWLARTQPSHATLFAEIKKTFDPYNLFAPGIIVPSQGDATEGHTIIHKAAVNTETAERHQLRLQLKWEVETPEHTAIVEAVERCATCGICRSHRDGVRMCPTSRAVVAEMMAPRACAQLLRTVLKDIDQLALLTTERARRLADVCLRCHRCRRECPAGVDMPHIAFRIKAAYVAAHGLSTTERVLVGIDFWLKFLSWVSCPVNWAFQNRSTRWLMEKLFGVPQQRRLPQLTKIPFLTRILLGTLRSSPNRSESPSAKVALFVDTYVNHFAPCIAEAAMALLKHNDVEVHVPLRQAASGLVAFAGGDADTATALARRNTTLLSGLVRQGYTIVTLEPASATCLKWEYPCVADDLDHRDDLDLLTANTIELTAYLWQLHETVGLRGPLRALPPSLPQSLPRPPHYTSRNTASRFFAGDTASRVIVAYHAPCRSLSLGDLETTEPTPAERLLRLIPAVEVCRIEKGCCGLGHSYGLRQSGYQNSLRMGMRLFAELRSQGTTLIATECNICRMQLEQGCRQPIEHPVTLLALACGFSDREVAT